MKHVGIWLSPRRNKIRCHHKHLQSGNAKCRKRLPDTTRRRKNIIHTLLAIMVKQRSTTKLDNTRKRLTTPIWRGRTQFTLEVTLKRRPKHTTKSTAINHSFSGLTAGLSSRAASIEVRRSSAPSRSEPRRWIFGRPLLCGSALGGAQGVQSVYEHLKNELIMTMKLAGTWPALRRS